MDLMIWVLVGLAAGRAAQMLLKDSWSSQTLGNLAVGVVGAVLVGAIVRATGFAGSGGFSILTPIAAIVGAAAALWAGRSFTSAPTLN